MIYFFWTDIIVDMILISYEHSKIQIVGQIKNLKLEKKKGWTKLRVHYTQPFTRKTNQTRIPFQTMKKLIVNLGPNSYYYLVRKYVIQCLFS